MIADDYAEIARALKSRAEQKEQADILALIRLATELWTAVGDPYAHEGQSEVAATPE